MQPATTHEFAPHPWRTIGEFSVARLFGNVFIRFPYVFLTALSSGLGVSIPTITTVLGLRELGGITMPAVGRIIDRGHLRTVMIGAGLVSGGTCAAIALTDDLAVFAVLIITGGIAKTAFDLTQNTWVSHRIAVAQRGRVTGVLEMAWAGSFLIGIPIVGLVIDRWGWQASFAVTGIALAAAALVTGRRVDDDIGPHRRELDPPTVSAGTHRAIPRRPMIAFTVAQPAAQMLVFAVNGDWFDDKLGMTTAAIGAATLLLGVGELVGTGLVAAYADRLGAARSGAVGLLVAGPMMLLLGLVGSNVVLGLAVLFVMDVGLEFSFVAVVGLFPETKPENPGRAISEAFTGLTLSRAATSVAAGWIYVTWGITAIGIAAAVCAAAGVAAMWSIERSGRHAA